MNPNLELRDYFNEANLHIDGRNIPYQLVTATDYFLAKNETWTHDDVEDFSEEYPDIYEIVTQIMALKQACVLMRHTSHSCQSLSDGLYYLKNDLINELKNDYGYEYDEALMGSHPEI